MDLNPSSCWNSILEKVKPHIPTIDFDFPTYQKDEIVTVYQRPAGLSLKVPEDFDSFSVDDAELEELLEAQNLSEETCRQLDDDDDDDETQLSPGPSDADVEAGACASSFVVSKNKPDTSLKPASHEMGLPVLSFVRLDQWDLDAVLENLKASRASLKEHVPVEPMTRCADGDNRSSQEDIMERLTALCKNQSLSEPAKYPNYIRQNNIWDESLEIISAGLNSHQERPTVYFDLRCPDASMKPARMPPNLSATNTHQETPPAMEHNLKVHIGLPMGIREVTVQNTSPQKTSEKNRNADKYQDKRTLHPEGEEMKDKPPQSGASTCRNESQKQIIDGQSSSVQSRRSNREQHEQEQEILKLLEKHRPTTSVHQKQPAAEKTDVLYHTEASQLESVSSLPAGTDGKGCVLLSINLSSPGVVRAHGRRRHPAATKSHIYNTLVAWLLSLADPDPRHDEVPFWVAGLQQLWTEDGLTLQVLAVARHCYEPRKRDVDTHTLVYHHVCKFLSETSLAVIADWLPHLQNLLDRRPYVSPIHLPPSRLSSFISATSVKNVIDRTFGVSPGFYWQTVETQDQIYKGRGTSQDLHTEVSVILPCSGFFQHRLITHYTLQLVLESGLDVCGLRLLYPPQRLLSDGGATVNQTADEPNQPVLALAVRGPYAHSLSKGLVRSLESELLKEIEKPSVEPLCTRNEDPRLVRSPQLAGQVDRELCLWFSGRLQGGQNPNQHLNRLEGSPSNLSRPPSFLCATTKGDLLLVVSPVVPPCCYIQVLAGCERRGFGLRGLHRVQLQSGEAAVLGLNNHQVSVFCSPTTSTLDQEELKPSPRCLVLLLRKENASRHSVGLPSALMREFRAQNLLSCLHQRVQTLEPSLCFHTVPFRSKLLHIFGRCMWAVPDPSSVILSRQKPSCNSSMEQVVVVTLCGTDMSQGLSLLHRVLTEGPKGDEQHAGFELLGLKWLPAPTRLQAQELSPYEVGEPLCYDSVAALMSHPALVCALRRFDAFTTLRKLLPQNHPNILMSPTPEVALRQASLVFFDDEMIPDPQMLLTVGIFKARVWSHTPAKILQQSGLTLAGLRAVTPDQTDAAPLLHLCSGPSVALCLRGENAVERLLDVLRQEDSSTWTTCYGSRSYQEALRDVRRFFPGGVCCTETSTMRQEQILSLCSDTFASAEREQRRMLTHVAQRSPSGASLWQTTCLLIPVNAPQHSPVHSQLEALEQLLRAGCHLVEGRMSKLDREQREHIAETLSSGGREKMARFDSGPCLIMALRGERIVAGLSLILESICKERSDLKKVVMIYPESEKEAKQLIFYLFDDLSPETCDASVP